MRTIDKNDVDISGLFKWKKEINIVDNITNNSKTVWVRLVGDADINRARVFGYREAADLRKKLRTPGTDERMAFMFEIGENTDVESLVQAVVFLRVQDLYAKAMSDSDYKEPKEPKSDAPQEDWENYQLAVDQYPERFKKEVEKNFLKLRKDTEKELRKLERDELFAVYESDVINRLCTQELEKSYYDMCTYLGIYKDEKCKVREFSSLEEFRDLHSSVKDRLVSEYKSLELGLDFLKQLPEATPLQRSGL